MLLSLRNDHKKHLILLKDQPIQVLVDFCKLAIDSLNNGNNEQLIAIAAAKLSVTAEDIKNCTFGLINLLLLSSMHKLNEVDFRDSILSLGFTEEHAIVLNKFYHSKKKDISDILLKLGVKESHFNNLEWRFELQVASRSLLHQVTPLITMDLSLESMDDNFDHKVEHHILQTDVNNLIHISNELERALNESRSRYCRQLQKNFSNS